MNDLIAVNAGDFFHTWEGAFGDDPLGWYVGVLGDAPAIGTIVSAVQCGTQFASGDWAGSLLSYASVAIDVASWAIDPFGTLLSSAAAFLMNYIPPLPQMLDALAGNPALVEGIGQTWLNIGDALRQQAEQLQAQMLALLATWQGAAANAYRNRQQLIIGMTTGAGLLSSSIGAGLMIASAVVAAVRELVRQICADLVGRLIAWAIEVAATVGVATLVVAAQATVAIADTTITVGKVTMKLIDALGAAGAAVSTIQAGLEQSQQVVEQLGARA